MSFPETKTVIALGLVASLVAMTFVLMFFPQASSNDLVKILIGGFMTVGFASIIQFYFGSSQGSKDKDDTISKIATDTKNK